MLTTEEKNIRINRLLPLIKKGDCDAIAAVIALLEKDLQRLAMRYLVNVQDAESVVNETFYKFFSKVKILNNETNLYAWLKTVVVNACFDVIKKYKREVSYESLIEKYSQTFSAAIADATEQLFVSSCLAKLTDEERTVLVFHAQGYTLAETAEITKFSMKKVRNRLSNAKKKFVNFYDKDKELQSL